MPSWRDSAAMRRSQFRIDCVSALTSEDRLSEALLQERFGLGDTVFIDVQGDDLIMEKKEPATPPEPALT